jgi:hypothetical protein
MTYHFCCFLVFRSEDQIDIASMIIPKEICAARAVPSWWILGYCLTIHHNHFFPSRLIICVLVICYIFTTLLLQLMQHCKITIRETWRMVLSHISHFMLNSFSTWNSILKERLLFLYLFVFIFPFICMALCNLWSDLMLLKCNSCFLRALLSCRHRSVTLYTAVGQHRICHVIHSCGWVQDQ